MNNQAGSGVIHGGWDISMQGQPTQESPLCSRDHSDIWNTTGYTSSIPSQRLRHSCVYVALVVCCIKSWMWHVLCDLVSGDFSAFSALRLLSLVSVFDLSQFTKRFSVERCKGSSMCNRCFYGAWNHFQSSSIRAGAAWVSCISRKPFMGKVSLGLPAEAWEAANKFQGRGQMDWSDLFVAECRSGLLVPMFLSRAEDCLFSKMPSLLSRFQISIVLISIYAVIFPRLAVIAYSWRSPCWQQPTTDTILKCTPRQFYLLLKCDSYHTADQKVHIYRALSHESERSSQISPKMACPAVLLKS